MKWYLKINHEELEMPEAMEILMDIKTRNWQDYLVLPGQIGFNVLRGLEEFLSDCDHENGTYQIRDDRGGRLREARSILVTRTKAIFKGCMIVWSPKANISSFYYREDKELNYIEKFGLKSPILIKCTI